MKPRLFMAADHVALPLLKAPWAAIQAAEAWLACPCEEHLDAWGGLIPVQGSGDPWRPVVGRHLLRRDLA